MLIIAAIAEVFGVALLVLGRPLAGAMSVLVPGLFLLVLGVVFLTRPPRGE